MQTFTPTTKKIIKPYEQKLQVQLLCTTAGRTKQAFKDECDVNVIIKRFLKTGIMDFANKNQPRYGDCTGLEYTQAMQTVAAAKSLFMEMPPHLRARFDNEPAKFLDFVQNEKNRDEARELGLLKPEAKRVEAEATPLAPSPAPAPQPAPAPAPAPK